MHRYYRLWSYEFDRVRGSSRSHCEMIADANEHDVDLIVIGDACDVGKKSGIAGMINGWTVANADDETSWHARGNRRGIFVFSHGRSMPRGNKTNRQLAIEQHQLSANVTGRVHACLIARGTKHPHNCGRQGEVRNQLRPPCFTHLN